jgi:putative regulator of septum formation
MTGASQAHRRGSAGPIAIAFAAALAIAGCGGKTGTAPALKVGDCFDVPKSEADFVDIPSKPCTQAHGAEVFHQFDARSTTGAYPSDEAWGQLIYPVCDPAFKAYTGTPVEERTDIDYLFLVPTSDRWAAGDRRVTCFIHALDDSPLSRSYRAGG